MIITWGKYNGVNNMEGKFYDILQRSDIKKLIKEIMSNKAYNDVDIPIPIETNYFVNNNYSLLLLLDALFKYILIIEEDRYLDSYIDSLNMIIKKMDNYNDIEKGVNTLLIKYVSKILNISNNKTHESKEKILRYIYKKYIVEGYFYYGYSSVHKNEIEEYGIRKSGFILDSRISEINDIIKKYEDKDVIRRVNANITDNFIVALYFAFIGPDYLEKLATSKVLNSDSNDNSFYYTKKYSSFIENIEKYISKNNFNSNDKNIILDNFVTVWKENSISKSHGCISFIKRSSLNHNYLKDFEEIVKNINNMNLVDAISMIMESRYTSYEIDEDISPMLIETIDIPSYNVIIDKNDNIELLDEDVSLENNLLLSNSYGFANICMFIGLILVSLGVTITIIISTMGW